MNGRTFAMTVKQEFLTKGEIVINAVTVDSKEADVEDIHICPIADVGTNCWVRDEGDPDDGVDIIAWIKARMVDGLNHEYAHALYGPGIFGYREDGSPDFEVFRYGDGPWLIRQRSSE